MRLTTVLVLAASLGTVPIATADGMLDPAFGNGGLVNTNFGPGPGDEHGRSLVMLPDGRAVAAGYVEAHIENWYMAVARYLASGALDTSFGGDGTVTVPFPPLPPFVSHAYAMDVLAQVDGRAVLVGGLSTNTGISFALARLNIDGSLDQSFGTGGRVTTAFPFNAAAFAGVLQPDGRIVAVGRPEPGSIIAAARYNVDGSLDPTFGIGGTLTVLLPVVVWDVALQPDGKLVIAGAHGGDFALVRLLPNGVLDPSFDGDGLATADFGGAESGQSVVLLSDGRLVVGGSRNADLAATRFHPDGALDTTFGSGGLATADSGVPESVEEMIRLPNGKLLLAGFTAVTGAARDFLLVRFHPDGALDTSFGTGGFLRTDFNGGQDECHAVAIAGPDLVLAAGTVQPVPPLSQVDFGLARYIATTPAELLTFEVQ